MPRRISDYADAFAGWNFLSSFGSIVSVIATWLFLQVLYVQLTEGYTTTRYIWLTPQFYGDLLQTLLNRASPSIEWAINSPPKPHAFVSLPIQSKISWEDIDEFITCALMTLVLFIVYMDLSIALEKGIESFTDHCSGEPSHFQGASHGVIVDPIATEVASSDTEQEVGFKESCGDSMGDACNSFGLVKEQVDIAQEGLAKNPNWEPDTGWSEWNSQLQDNLSGVKDGLDSAVGVMDSNPNAYDKDLIESVNNQIAEVSYVENCVRVVNQAADTSNTSDALNVVGQYSSTNEGLLNYLHDQVQDIAEPSTSEGTMSEDSMSEGSTSEGTDR